MRKSGHAFRGRGLATALAAASLSLAAVGASAQPFENIFGPAATLDQGARRVSPVEVCPGGGFIAVGTTGLASTGINVNVVRTRDDGSPLWELTYDVGPGGIDRGQALAEARDGSGFIIAGTTRLGAGTDDVLLLKIKCEGGPVWATAYVNGLPKAGFDVVEAQSGDPAFGTRRGDILVAGYAANPAGNRDAFLMRTRSDGTLIWNNRYDVNNATEIFRGLTEARPSGGTTTGDVVAVGQIALPGAALQGYALRVSGNTGLFVAPVHVGAVHGGGDRKGYESVVELRTPPVAGTLVMVGSRNSAATASDVLLVRTAPNPAFVVTARFVGEPAGTALGEEAALDVRETRNPLPVAAPGSLALTGRVGRPGTTSADAFLLLADPSSLKPLGPGFLYGDHGARRDWGVSIADHPRGFVIAGFSDSDFEGVGDPRDLYLIGTDENGKTGCAEPWDPPHDTLQFPVARVMPQAVRTVDPVRREVKVEPIDTAFRKCP